MLIFILPFFSFFNEGKAQNRFFSDCFDLRVQSYGDSLAFEWDNPWFAEFNFSKYEFYVNDSSRTSTDNFQLFDSSSFFYQNSYYFLGVQPDIQIFVYIKLYDSNGNFICQSNEVNVISGNQRTEKVVQNMATQRLSNGIRVHWQKAIDTTEFQAYLIYTDTLWNQRILIDTLYNLNDTSYILTSLDSQKIYFSKVAVLDTHGIVHAFSNEVFEIQSPITPLSPQNLQGNLIHPSLLNLQWNPTNYYGFRRYVVFQGTGGSGLIPYFVTTSGDNSQSQIQIMNLSQNVDYRFSVASEDFFGNLSVLVDTFQLTTLDTIPPPIPSGVQAQGQTNAVLITWNPVNDSVGDFFKYNIYADTVSQASIYVGEQFGVSDTSFSLPGLQNGRTYFFRVTSEDINGNESNFSAEVSATPGDFTPPPPVSNFAATIDSAKTRLSWTENVNVDNDFAFYEIRRGFFPTTLQVVDTIFNLNTTNYWDLGLKNNRVYHYEIRSYDTLGNFEINSPTLFVLPMRVEQELNNLPSISNQLDSAKIGEIDNPLDRDVFYFDVNQVADVTIRTFAVNPLHPSVGTNIGNTMLTLFDTSGQNQIAFNNNSPNNPNYSEINIILNPGRYFVRVQGFSPSNVGYYLLKLDLLQPDFLEPNNDIFTASQLLDTQVVNNLSIFPLGDLDYFRFEGQVNHTARVNFNVPFYTGQISFIDTLENILQSSNSNIGSFIVPYDAPFFIRYSIPGFVVPNYSIDFKLVPPISYADTIIINEINYSQSNYQFIELYNRSANDISIHGFNIPHLNFNFPANSIFPGNSFITIARDSAGFHNQYGFDADYIWPGNFQLSGSNANLVLEDSLNALVDAVHYRALQNFPIFSDLDHSMELISTDLNNNIGTNWVKSHLKFGTPGHENSLPQVYAPDGLGLINSFSNALYFESNFSLTGSLSELFDSSDVFLVRTRIADTLVVSLDYLNPNLLAEVGFYDKNGNLLFGNFQDGANQNYQYVVPFEDSLYIKVRLKQNGLQFILNEGFYQLDVKLNHKPIVSPWLETFETSKASLIPAGWSRLNLDSNSNRWAVSVVNIGVGNTRGLSLSGNPQGNNDWIITPPIEVRIDDEFSFFSRASASNFPETCVILVGSEHANKPLDFHTILDTIVVDSVGYKEFVYDLDAFVGQNVRIAIQNISVNQNLQYIDNVSISLPFFNAVLVGEVRDFDTGAPLDNVRVSLGDKRVFTIADGSYVFQDINYGYQFIQFEKNRYSKAKFGVMSVEGDTMTLDIRLKANTLDTLYYNSFDSAGMRGLSFSSGTQFWSKRASINHNQQQILPVSGDSMLAFGGNNGYLPNQFSFWKSGLTTFFNLKPYDELKFDFDINHNVDTNSGIYFLGNETFILDINQDNQVDIDDVFRGNSGSWSHKQADFTYLNSFSNFEFAIVFNSDSSIAASGFGAAIDNILFTGYKPVDLEIPRNLEGSDYVNDAVPLQWSFDYSLQPDSFKIYRKLVEDRDYNYLASSNDTFYVDSSITNQFIYNYKVSAAYPFGESDFSNQIAVNAGIPDTLSIPYFQDFDTVSSNLAPFWSFNLSSFNPWQIGDSAEASTFNNPFKPNGKFAYINFFTIGLLEEYFESALASPWFDFSQSNDRIILDFQASGFSFSEFHIVAVKTSLGGNWIPIDTLPSMNNWRRFKYDITDLMQGQNFAQVGFIFRNNPTNLQLPNQGFAINNFSISEVKPLLISGNVSSQTGNGFNNLPIELLILDSATLSLPTSYVLTTDSIGNYNTQGINLLNGIPYQLKASAWQHYSSESSIISPQHIDTLNIDLVLDVELKAPTALRNDLDSLGNPILMWNSPKLLGEVSVDNNILSFQDSLIAQKTLGVEIKSNATLPAKLNQIAVFVESGNAVKEFDLIACRLNALGLPNESDTLFTMNAITIPAGVSGWHFVNIGKQVNESNYYLLLKQSASNLGLKIGYTAQLTTNKSVLKTAGGTYAIRPETMMLRAFYQVGEANFNYTDISFSGTYQLYRKVSAGPYQLLAQNLVQEEYYDTSLNYGDTANYRVLASSAFGNSDSSNILHFVKKGIPFLRVLARDKNVRIPNNQNSAFKTVPIENIGLDTLTYQLSYHIGFLPQHQLDTPKVNRFGLENSSLISWKHITKGIATEVELFLEHPNLNNEQLSKVELIFPAGIHVNNSTNLAVFNSSRVLLTNGATGDSARVIFNPLVSGTAPILPFDIAKTTLNITVDTNFSGLPFVDYRLHGNKGFVLNKRLIFQNAPISMFVPSPTGSVLAGNSTSLPITVDVVSNQKNETKIPGYFTLQSNDPQKPEVDLPFDVYLSPAFGVIRGNVSDRVSNQAISNATIQWRNQSIQANAQGNFIIDSVDVGLHQIFVDASFYHQANRTITLNNLNDTIFANFLLDPNIRKPKNLTATGISNAIDLTWELEDFNLLFEMDEPDFAIPNTINDWKIVDADADGNQWEYFGVGPYSGKSSVSVLANNSGPNDDWLISKKLRVEEVNATLKFWLAPQDLVLNQEEIEVRVSTGNDDLQSFTDSVFYYKFPLGNSLWQQFTVSLGQYLGDSIHVAFRCISNGQFRIKLDEVEFTSVQLASSPIDSNVYYYDVYRSVNGGNYTQIHSFNTSNDTAAYSDLNVIRDSVYTYYIKHFFPFTNVVSERSNFASYRLLSKDVGITAIVSPKTSRNLSDTEQVVVRIQNFGTDSILSSDTLSLGFQLLGSATINQQVSLPNDLAPGQNTLFAFNDRIDLSAKGAYQISAWASINGDINTNNDTANKAVNHLPDTIIPPTWSVNPFGFQFNMAVTAEVYILDTLAMNPNTILAAFSGNQVRGVSQIEYIPNFNKYVAQMTVYSNLSIENITFKVWDANRDSVFPINESLTFINNQIYGSLLNPIKLYTPSPNNNFDIGVSAILSPIDGNLIYDVDEFLEVSVTNYGSRTFSQGDTLELGFELRLDNQLKSSDIEKFVLTQDFTNQASVQFAFNTLLNMEDTGTYNLKVFSLLPNDFNALNDTSTTIITHRPNLQVPDWTVNPGSFQYSAFLTARVLIDDILSMDANDKVAAMINGQVRGVANVGFVPNFNQWVVQMPIYHNSTSGGTISFKAFDYSNGVTLFAEEKLTFLNNENFGNLLNPVRLHFVIGYNSVQKFGDESLPTFYPNPTQGTINLRGITNEKFLILENALGENIRNFRLEGEYQSIDLGSLAPGVYFISYKYADGSASARKQKVMIVN